MFFFLSIIDMGLLRAYLKELYNAKVMYLITTTKKIEIVDKKKFAAKEQYKSQVFWSYLFGPYQPLSFCS